MSRTRLSSLLLGGVLLGMVGGLGCRGPLPSLPTVLGPPSPPPTLQMTVSVIPGDAVLTVGDEAGVVGAVSLSGRPPGEYTITATRPGFATLSQVVSLAASSGDLSLALEPLPQPFSFSVVPSGASWTLTTAQGAVVTGSGAWSGTVPSGETSVVFAHPGHNPRTWSRFVDMGVEGERVWLDRAGQVVEKRLEFKSGHHPKGLRFSPDGSQIWASFLGGPPSVAGYDVRTGQQVHALTLGKHGAVEVLYSLDGSTVYASQMETASVYEIDRVLGSLRRVLSTKATWSKIMALSPDGQRMYVSNWVSSDITELDLVSGSVLRELDTVDTPRGLWVDPAGAWLYVLGYGDGRLQRIQLSTGRREDLFTSSGGTLRHIVGDASRGRLYISDMRKGVIWLVELETWKATRLAQTDPNPNTIDLTPDGRLLFVSCRGQNNRESYYKPGPQWGSILVLDALTGTLLDAIVAGNQPTALDVSEDGTLLAYSDMLDDRISVYRIPSPEVLAAGGGGRGPVYKAELRKR